VTREASARGLLIWARFSLAIFFKQYYSVAFSFSVLTFFCLSPQASLSSKSLYSYCMLNSIKTDLKFLYLPK
jgi:hypothetical protein